MSESKPQVKTGLSLPPNEQLRHNLLTLMKVDPNTNSEVVLRIPANGAIRVTLDRYLSGDEMRHLAAFLENSTS